MLSLLPWFGATCAVLRRRVPGIGFRIWLGWSDSSRVPAPGGTRFWVSWKSNGAGVLLAMRMAGRGMRGILRRPRLRSRMRNGLRSRSAWSGGQRVFAPRCTGFVTDSETWESAACGTRRMLRMSWIRILKMVPRGWCLRSLLPVLVSVARRMSSPSDGRGMRGDRRMRGWPAVRRWIFPNRGACSTARGCSGGMSRAPSRLPTRSARIRSVCGELWRGAVRLSFACSPRPR